MKRLHKKISHPKELNHTPHVPHLASINGYSSSKNGEIHLWFGFILGVEHPGPLALWPCSNWGAFCLVNDLISFSAMQPKQDLNWAHLIRTPPSNMSLELVGEWWRCGCGGVDVLRTGVQLPLFCSRSPAACDGHRCQLFELFVPLLMRWWNYGAPPCNALPICLQDVPICMPPNNKHHLSRKCSINSSTAL